MPNVGDEMKFTTELVGIKDLNAGCVFLLPTCFDVLATFDWTSSYTGGKGTNMGGFFLEGFRILLAMMAADLEGWNC
jgi:hypothetical protein